MSKLDVGSGCEVIDGPGSGSQDLSSGQSTAVNLEIAFRVRHGQGVVPYCWRLRVLVGVKIEVGVVGQHQGGLVGQRSGKHLYVQFLRRDRIHYACLNVADHVERGVRLVQYRESDAIVRDSSDVPEAPGPIIVPAMQSVVSVILLGVICYVVNGVLSVSNAIDVSPGNRVVDWVAFVLG